MYWRGQSSLDSTEGMLLTSYTHSTQINAYFVLMLWGLLHAIDWQRGKRCQVCAEERNNY